MCCQKITKGERTMKRKVLSILLAAVLCIATCNIAYAEQQPEPEVAVVAVDANGIIVPMATISLSCGLTHVSGSTYRLWAVVTCPAVENLRVYVYLYDSNGNTVASVYNTAYSHSVTAATLVNLSPGSYSSTAYGFGDTDYVSAIRNYRI